MNESHQDNNPFLAQDVIQRDLEWAQAHLDRDLAVIDDIAS